MLSSSLAQFRIFLILSISVSAFALDFDSIGPLENDLLFSDTESAASLDHRPSSPMFELAQLPPGFDLLPFDSSPDIFLEEEGNGSNDINIYSSTSGNDNDIFLLSSSSEPAHADDEGASSYQDGDDDANSEDPLIALVDEETTFFPSDENADADAGAASGNGDVIADLSGSDELLLRSPFGALNRDLYQNLGQGKINPYCSLYTKTYNPVGVCASNKKGNQVEIPRYLRGFSLRPPFSGYKFWDVNHATYGTWTYYDWKSILNLLFFFATLFFADLYQSLISSQCWHFHLSSLFLFPSISPINHIH